MSIKSNIMYETASYYDYYSLHKLVDQQSGIKNFFIFDDIFAFAENFHYDMIINFPLRLGMVAVIMCKKGFIKLRIGLEHFTVEQNMTLVILPEQVFELLEVGSEYKARYILLEENFFDVHNDFRMSLDLQYQFFKQPCVKFPEKEAKEGDIIFRLIKDNIRDKNNMFLKEIVQTYVRLLFYLVSNILIKSNEKTIKTRKEEIFENFISLLQKNFRRERKISWYADKIFLTPKYLSKLIFEVSGRHAGVWIRDYVIIEAKALLNSSSLTIQQISNELGFSNQSHFGSYFKRFTGVSPKQYKNRRITN